MKTINPEKGPINILLFKPIRLLIHPADLYNTRFRPKIKQV
jgi:hypothetical protein